MAEARRRREVGRGERVLPGVWRLRLPLPWPGVPHCNAWALAAGDGIVLVDTGMHEPGSMGHLERALEQVGLKLDHVRLLVCTHAHSDHYGEAATIVERTGCELWIHPAYEHVRLAATDYDAALERRIEVALQSGVPEEPLRAYQESQRGTGIGIAGLVPPDRELVPGVVVDTDLGPWTVHETPGHAPSHVCLFQPDRRLLISGDHLLGRVSLYYDFGHTPDPAGEFLRSLDVVDALDARLCLPGHGRTFTDVHAHVEANRVAVRERIARVLEVVGDGAGPLTAFEAVPLVYGQPVTPATANWWLSETLTYLVHLEREGRARRIPGRPERWTTL
ncbi:MAG TPA: MBL fold metallo-hydrolase [Solirubrobacteraceae bacterium]|jgi:glyoxylase-like metal-dependent hydrolase (beta-lactamase superfamily II)|nr:MBL fold metallo-hydrolase [Solirubrobacteraceae bacterium]